jgi:hypothetical protein
MFRTPVAPPGLGTSFGNAVLCTLAALCVPAFSQVQGDTGPGDDPLAAVEVTGTKNPELQRYRSMAGGLDAFDEHRSLAPNATLKARLSRRSDLWGGKGNVDGITLRLVGNETSIPIPIAADGTFVLPRSQAAYDEDADLVVNQKKSTVRWFPDVRTPGVPPNARRLGDLRMECQVLIGVAKKEINFAQRAAATLLMGTDWCASPRVTVATPLGDYAMSAVVAYGGKRINVPTTGYRLQAPIRDKSLPDDALVEFEPWSQASLERKRYFLGQWPIQLKSSADKWKTAVELRAAENAQLRGVLALGRGSWKFRLGSPAGEIQLGAMAADTVAPIGTALPLKWQGPDLVLDVAQAGFYEFLLDVRDPDRPAVTITPVDAANGVRGEG